MVMNNGDSGRRYIFKFVARATPYLLDREMFDIDTNDLGLCRRIFWPNIPDPSQTGPACFLFDVTFHFGTHWPPLTAAKKRPMRCYLVKPPESIIRIFPPFLWWVWHKSFGNFEVNSRWRAGSGGRLLRSRQPSLVYQNACKEKSDSETANERQFWNISDWHVWAWGKFMTVLGVCAGVRELFTL